MSKDIREQIDKIKSLNNPLVFYHNSDYNFNEFIKQNKYNKASDNYLFFSKDKNAFIERKFTYTVELRFNSKKIFNTFSFIKDFGLTNSLELYGDEVKQLLSNNVDYFLNEWGNVNVDSQESVIEYYENIGGDGNDKVGLLYYFLTKWNDSWVILETDIFLKFIESKGFDGFITVEEGIINIALRDNFTANIINKEHM